VVGEEKTLMNPDINCQVLPCVVTLVVILADEADIGLGQKELHLSHLGVKNRKLVDKKGDNELLTIV
jgi:hypothetical protein